MTFKEKYNKLKNLNYVIEMITKSVYDTMHLEGQGLPKAEVEKLVKKVMEEPEPGLMLHSQ